MKLITTKYGEKIKVDDDDFSFINKWSWTINISGHACRNAWDGKRYQKLYMHRLINKTPKGFDTDHINRDKLDNQKENLRTATRAQNNFNTPPSKANTSGIKGVCKSSTSNRWRAYIKHGGKQINLGYFFNKNDAIKARQEAEAVYS